MAYIEFGQKHAGDTVLVRDKLARQVLALASAELPVDGSEGVVATVPTGLDEGIAGSTAILFAVDAHVISSLIDAAQQRLADHAHAA